MQEVEYTTLEVVRYKMQHTKNKNNASVSTVTLNNLIELKKDSITLQTENIPKVVSIPKNSVRNKGKEM